MSSGGDDFFTGEGGPLEAGQPVTYYFVATCEIAEGYRRAYQYRTIRIDGSTASDFGSIVAEAEQQAQAMADEGESCPGGVVTNLELIAPTYYQYSRGLL